MKLNKLVARVPLTSKLIVVVVIAATKFKFEFNTNAKEELVVEESRVPIHSYNVKLKLPIYKTNLLYEIR
jgi:hypothetical protein